MTTGEHLAWGPEHLVGTWTLEYGKPGGDQDTGDHIVLMSQWGTIITLVGCEIAMLD